MNFSDIKQIEKTHRHINVTEDSADVSSESTMPGLEDFTKYSIIACAYNSYGPGPVTSIFNRTLQGGM